MKFENFEKICSILREESETLSRLEELNVSLVNFIDPYHNIFEILIKEIYGEEGAEWFIWFCYESDFGEKDWSKYDSYQLIDGVMTKIHSAGDQRYGATDEKGNPVCTSVKSTWEFLEKRYRKNKKK